MKTAMTSEGAGLRGLYAVTPAIADTSILVARVREALEGGAALVQYRAKDVSPGLALMQARALAALCRAAGVPLIVNDSLELAAAVGADGVHLGRDDAGVREARIALPKAIIGASCYADPELRALRPRPGPTMSPWARSSHRRQSPEQCARRWASSRRHGRPPAGFRSLRSAGSMPTTRPPRSRPAPTCSPSSPPSSKPRRPRGRAPHRTPLRPTYPGRSDVRPQPQSL
jgi:hypothetical protein